jgi:mono/diheme cytochrome c family protein
MRSGGGRSARSALAAVVVASWVLAACGAGTSDEGTSGGTGPDGAGLYERHCASCHGADLRGTDRGPSQLSEVYEPGHHPDASFRSAITAGSRAHHWDFGDMPPVDGLDDAEIDAIIAHIRARQQAEGFEPYPPD